MQSSFGLYISAIGVALVFATLLAIGLLSEVAIRVFPAGKKFPEKKSNLAKVAATAAILMATESRPHQKHQQKQFEGDKRWKVTARIEALDRWEGNER